METNLRRGQYTNVQINDAIILVVDRAEELESRRDFELRLVGLDNGADDGNVDVLGANVVRGRNASDVDV